MIHFYDKRSMVYTGCWQLPFNLETSADHKEVTCPRCLQPNDVEGNPLGLGDLALLPNGAEAVVVGLVIPEIVVVFRGEQVNLPGREVVLLAVREAK